MSEPTHIFILGCHKSGTSLLRSLLDDHNDLFVVPIESHFFRLTGHWINYPLKRSHQKNLTWKEKTDYLSSWIKYLNDPTALSQLKYSDSVTKGMWNEDIFINELCDINIKSISSKTQNEIDAIIYNKYINSIFSSLNHGCKLDKSLVVEKSVENFDIAPLIKKILPKAKFIHVVRNPYANLVALRKRCKNYPFLVREIISIYSSLNKAQMYAKTVDDYKLVRYEDLVSKPKETMQQLSSFLEIPYSESMIIPTSQGEPWAGNSTSNINFSAISMNPIEKWKKVIDDIEIGLINELFDTAIEISNYERVNLKGSIYRPGKNEYPIAYLLNRLLYFYLRRWNKSISNYL